MDKKDKVNPHPKYGEGDKVKSTMNIDEVLTITGEPKWNGYGWMYSFREIDMRCTEGRLSLVVEVPVRYMVP
jgi:hypothetical protein